MSDPKGWDGLEYRVDPDIGNPNAVVFLPGSFLFLRLPSEHVLIPIGGHVFSRQWFPEIDGDDIRLCVYCRVTPQGVEMSAAFRQFMEDHGTRPAVLRGREMFRLHDTFGLNTDLQIMRIEDIMRSIQAAYSGENYDRP